MPPSSFAAAVVRGAEARALKGTVTSPKEFFGHNIGDDYFLRQLHQFMEYWKKLDGESDRMQVVEIGKTVGRPAAADGHHHGAGELHEARSATRRSRSGSPTGEGLTDDQARALAKEGKAVVWIDGGLHATEVARRAAADRDDLPARQRGPTRRRCAS